MPDSSAISPSRPTRWRVDPGGSVAGIGVSRAVTTAAGADQTAEEIVDPIEHGRVRVRPAAVSPCLAGRLGQWFPRRIGSASFRVVFLRHVSAVPADGAPRHMPRGYVLRPAR